MIVRVVHLYVLRSGCVAVCGLAGTRGGKPVSGSLAWCAGDENGVQSHGIDVRISAFYELCRSYHTWEASKGGFVNDTVQAVELGSFTPRKPVQVRMCWDP